MTAQKCIESKKSGPFLQKGLGVWIEYFFLVKIRFSRKTSINSLLIILIWMSFYSNEANKRQPICAKRNQQKSNINRTADFFIQFKIK